VATPLRFHAALAEAVALGPVLVAWERESERPLRAGLHACLSVSGAAGSRVDSRSPLALFVGPEGGFTEAEIQRARAVGAVTVSVGPRILRTETAGPIVAALALYESGDLDPVFAGSGELSVRGIMT
jgi:16S rRNA (uracil1498-N3)-methyltransferase